MPVVCINRPNRKVPRLWRSRDLRRIAKLLDQRGSPVPEIVGSVLVALGLGFLICKAADAIHRSLGIIGLLKQLSAVLATAALGQALLSILRRLIASPIARPPLIGAVLVALYFFVQAIIKGAAALVEDLATIEEISAVLDSWCTYIRVNP